MLNSNLYDNLDEVFNNYVDVSKTDLQGNITYVSNMFCETMGYSKDELIGKSHNIVKSPYSDDSVYNELWKNISQNKPYTATIQNRSKNGELIWFEALIKPEFDENGEKIGYIAYRKNITEQKKLKELVEKQIEQIRQKDQQLHEQAKINSMGNMIHNIAHQWRQPLSLISSVASSLSLKLELGVFDKNEAIENLEELNKSVQFLSNTINDFSSFFQKDNEQVKIGLIETFNEATSIVQVNTLNQHIQLINEFPDKEVYIKGYKADLVQALLNIINNAEDVLKNKNLEERYIFTHIYQNEQNVIIEITDSGDGIPEDIIDNILEPYFTTKHQSQGTGLGLYMSNEIINKLLRGKLSISNKENEYNGKKYFGASFKISLPIEE